MHAETVHVCIDAHHSTVMLHNVVVDRIRMQMFGEYLGDVVLHRPEECPIKIVFVFGVLEVLGDQSLRFEAHRDVSHLVALAMHAKVQYAFALLQITHAQPTSSSRRKPWYSSVARMARSRLPLR